jgi:hypothetical protein
MVNLARVTGDIGGPQHGPIAGTTGTTGATGTTTGGLAGSS